MSGGSETLADVLAEMRIFKCRNLETGELELCRAIANYFADRIEAAWKREEQTYLDQIRDAVNQWGHEKYKAERAPIGNSAAMREVVKELLDAMYDMGIDEETVSIAAESPNCHMHSVELLSVIKKAKAALSAPPRQCDVYKTPEESIRMFESYIRESGKVGFINPFTEVVKWLFAPAAEREGEADGSK